MCESTSYQIATVLLPSSNAILGRQREINLVDAGLLRVAVVATAVLDIAQQTLIVGRVVCLVEASRQTKVRHFNMAVFVDKNVVWLDIAIQYSR